jgi:hypothetical protein
MRLRITRQLQGSIDGIQLDQFVPGQIYDVGTAVGSYLLSMEAAEPVGDETAATALTFEQLLFRKNNPGWVERAADRDPRGNRKKGR